MLYSNILALTVSCRKPMMKYTAGGCLKVAMNYGICHHLNYTGMIPGKPNRKNY